jgi:hypothetical protein
VASILPLLCHRMRGLCQIDIVENDCMSNFEWLI